MEKLSQQEKPSQKSPFKMAALLAASITFSQEAHAEPVTVEVDSIQENQSAIENNEVSFSGAESAAELAVELSTAGQRFEQMDSSEQNKATKDLVIKTLNILISQLKSTARSAEQLQNFRDLSERTVSDQDLERFATALLRSDTLVFDSLLSSTLEISSLISGISDKDPETVEVLSVLLNTISRTYQEVLTPELTAIMNVSTEFKTFD